MKKYVVGFLAGVFLTFSVSAYADDIKNLIGQKVQGTVSVNVNGTQVADGVIIKGNSYAPVRSLTEAAGLDVNYDKGVVTVINTKNMINTTGKEITMTLEQVNSSIASLQQSIEFEQKNIDRYKILLQDKQYEKQWTTFQTSMDAVQLRLDKYQTRLDEMNALKAKLQP
ncbi:hypothetical protein MKY64_30540 [Paenibacillus sp. FSL R7-0210]|uniref:hypothetical protein n=1 Tax=Paenibacillus sp. FSL R7-0210 TaxID=2921676 RepID=UPI0030F5E318